MCMIVVAVKHLKLDVYCGFLYCSFNHMLSLFQVMTRGYLSAEDLVAQKVHTDLMHFSVLLLFRHLVSCV
jgi:hypothetical protein